MNRKVILVILLAAVIAAILWFGTDTAQAAEAGGLDAEAPKPPPLFKPLPPGEEKVATVQTSSGPVTVVQRWDTSGVNQILKPTAPSVPIVKAATITLPGMTRL